MSLSWGSRVESSTSRASAAAAARVSGSSSSRPDWTASFSSAAPTRPMSISMESGLVFMAWAFSTAFIL